MSSPMLGSRRSSAFLRVNNPSAYSRLVEPLLIGDLEIAVQILQSQRAREAFPAFGDFVGRQARHARGAGVGLFVAIAGADGVVAIARARLGNLILGADLLQARRIFDFAAQLVAALVQPAPLHAQLGARTGIGAEIDIGRVQRALGGNEHHIDRHHAVGGMFQIRRDSHRREIVRVDQRLLQRQQLVRRVILTVLPKACTFARTNRGTATS